MKHTDVLQEHMCQLQLPRVQQACHADAREVVLFAVQFGHHLDGLLHVSVARDDHRRHRLDDEAQVVEEGAEEGHHLAGGDLESARHGLAVDLGLGAVGALGRDRGCDGGQVVEQDSTALVRFGGDTVVEGVGGDGGGLGDGLKHGVGGGWLAGRDQGADLRVGRGGSRNIGAVGQVAWLLFVDVRVAC